MGSTLALAACGSASSATSPATSAARSGSAPAATAASTASSSAAAVPAGYQRVGGTAQGISVAAPASWVQINLATQSIQAAANSLDVHGISASSLVQDMESLQKLHAVFVVDVSDIATSPKHFAANLNALCVASGVTEAGSAGVPYLKSLMAGEIGKTATHVTQQDVVIGGVPGVETSYQLTSSADGTIIASQLEVLPKPDKVCFVTLTTLGSSQPAAGIPRVAAATAQFP